MLIILGLTASGYVFLAQTIDFVFVGNLAVTIGCIGYVLIYYYRTK